MAYRRSITSRSKLFYQQGNQPICTSVSHLHGESRDQEEVQKNPILKNPEICRYFHGSVFGSINSFSTVQRARNLYQDRGIRNSLGSGLVFYRNFSSESVAEGSAGNISVLKDVATDLGEKSIEIVGQASPVVNEVAVAAADSYFPVAAIQYLIDYVHVFTGLNWWAAVALTTICIRLLQLPVSLHLLKVTSKLNLMRSDLEKLQAQWEDKGMDMFQQQAQVKALYKQHGVSPFSPFKGILISGPIFCSLFFAIRTMAEKVPSFKDGGIFWFTDLTTPDSMYIFPVLTALSFLITVELNAQEGLEGNPTAGPVKMISRAFAVLTVPLTLSFPKAIFCYWIPSNLFSLAYGYVVKQPEVKKFLGIPIVPMPPSTSTKKPIFSFFPQMPKLPSVEAVPVKAEIVEERGVVSSSSNLSERIKRLEKQVKGKKKGKKGSMKTK